MLGKESCEQQYTKDVDSHCHLDVLAAGNTYDVIPFCLYILLSFWDLDRLEILAYRADYRAMLLSVLEVVWLHRENAANRWM